MGALHSEPMKLRSPFTGGVIDVAWVTHPSGPRESIECVRYSPTAASTPWMTPGDCSKTAPPLGTFHPAEVLPQRTSPARAGDACKASAPAAQMPAQSPAREGRNREPGLRIRTPRSAAGAIQGPRWSAGSTTLRTTRPRRCRGDPARSTSAGRCRRSDPGSGRAGQTPTRSWPSRTSGRSRPRASRGRRRPRTDRGRPRAWPCALATDAPRLPGGRRASGRAPGTPPRRAGSRSRDRAPARAGERACRRMRRRARVSAMPALIWTRLSNPRRCAQGPDTRRRRATRRRGRG